MNKYVKALKLAKKRLIGRVEDYSDGSKSPFICITLRQIARQDDDLAPYCYSLIDYISDCMGGYGFSLEQWLEINGHIESCSGIDKAFAYEMYNYRLAWIDELIRLYKGKKNDERKMINEHDLKDWIHLNETPISIVPKKTYVRWFDQYYFFDHLDGMYGYCTDLAGNVLHIAAATMVVPLRKPVKKENDE